MPEPKTRDQWLAENSRQIEVNGECLTLAQAAARYGLKKRTLILRLARGWSDHDAVLTPVRSRGGARA